MEPRARVEAALEAAGSQRVGSNWTCPAHDDRTPSLSVGTGADGQALVFCFAGCRPDEILAAIGLPWRSLWPSPPGKKEASFIDRIDEVYAYTDETSQPLYEVIRLGGPKDFRQRAPDGTWATKGIRRVLYRLPSVITARDAGETIWVVEGEKDVHALEAEGLVATCNPGGAGKWRDEYAEFLAGADVVVVQDRDEPGRRHARAVQDSLTNIARSIRRVEARAGQDAADHIAAGHRLDDFVDVTGDEDDRIPPAERRDSDQGGSPKSQRDRLLELIGQERVEFFHDPDGRGYISVDVDGHLETHDLKSSAVQRWLSRVMYQGIREAPSSETRSAVLNVLDARAQFDGPEREVFVRLGGDRERLYLDLGTPDWGVIEVDQDGWRRVDARELNIRFRRPGGLRALPEPVRGGRLEDLRNMLNLASDDDFVLIVAWLFGALRSRGPYPVLALYGEQGSAKSTTARMLREVLDPNGAPVRAEPREERDLMIAARNGWIIALDNLSHLRAGLSDALCRLSTGGGFSTRELYTDLDEVIFDAQRPVMINGITEVVVRGDLLDRCIAITLPVISSDGRRAEADVWSEFRRVHAGILGALLDAVSVALRRVPAVQLDDLPRMADFATWVVAAEPALPWPAGGFMAAYRQAGTNAVTAALEASRVSSAVIELVHEHGAWSGISRDLLDTLSELVSGRVARSQEWPKSPAALSNEVRRIAPLLRAAGIEAQQRRSSGRQRDREWHLSFIETGELAGSSRPNRPKRPVRKQNESESETETHLADDTDASDALVAGRTAPAALDFEEGEL